MMKWDEIVLEDNYGSVHFWSGKIERKGGYKSASWFGQPSLKALWQLKETFTLPYGWHIALGYERPTQIDWTDMPNMR